MELCFPRRDVRQLLLKWNEKFYNYKRAIINSISWSLPALVYEHQYHHDQFLYQGSEKLRGKNNYSVP